MNCNQYAALLGTLPSTVGLPWLYFQKRGILLDCRGPIVISEKSVWGFLVRVYTQSHDIKSGPGHVGKVVPYGVTVEEGAWIGSGSLLAGCHIGKGAIVAAGTVVRGQTVWPDIIVAGNPARVIARWKEGAWIYSPEESGYQRELL